VFDEFRSDELGPGHRSVAVRLRFRASDRTLTDAEVGDLRERCIGAVTREHHAELRG
jgi:phenylalanyl-tRNA synthetase beta chain